VAGAGSGSAEVEKDVEEHRYSLVLQAQEVGLFVQRYHVDQPRTQTEGQGNSGDGLHHKQVQVDPGWWEGGSWPTALPPPPQRGASAQHGARIRQDKASREAFAKTRGTRRPLTQYHGKGKGPNPKPLNSSARVYKCGRASGEVVDSKAVLGGDERRPAMQLLLMITSV
jgi:hypothetical protein